MKNTIFRKVVLKSFGILFCFAFISIVVNTDFSVMGMSNGSFISYEQLNQINDEARFGKFISASLDEGVDVGNGNKQSKLKFKLFGLFTVKEVSVNVSEGKEVFVGGIPLGFSINTKGVIVIGENSVITNQGNVIPEKTKEVYTGDILTSINGNEINSVDVIKNTLENCGGEKVKIKAMRKGKEFEFELKPALDVESGLYKLGFWVRDDASGIGTLTYVDKENKSYGALGHAITDFETGAVVPVNDGKIYNCSLIGVNKGKKGKPGELRCLFLQGKNSKGNVQKNTTSGVFGKISNTQGIVDENLTAMIGGRLSVKPGKAKIVSSVSGVREEYEIEIIKANYQSKTADKSMIFKVTDKRLLQLTGGILQGMSGSPILQDGKLIGAVTHVFLNDPTKGYGIYVDWMLENKVV